MLVKLGNFVCKSGITHINKLQKKPLINVIMIVFHTHSFQLFQPNVMSVDCAHFHSIVLLLKLASEITVNGVW